MCSSDLVDDLVHPLVGHGLHAGDGFTHALHFLGRHVFKHSRGLFFAERHQQDCRVYQVTWKIQSQKTRPDPVVCSLFTMAAERGIDPTTLATQLVPGGAIYFAMSDEDVDRILAHPLVMIGSDGLPHDPVPHPRLWGTFCACAGALRAPTPAAGARRRGAQDDGPARTPLWAGHTRRTARRRCR